MALAIRDGDEEALEALVEQALARLIQIVKLDGASTEDAEEAAQDGLFNSLRRLPELNFEGFAGKDPFLNYLIRAARRVNFQRHRADVSRGRGPGQIESPDERRHIEPGGDGSGITEDPEDEDVELLEDLEESAWASTEDGRIAALRAFLETLSPEDRLMLQLDVEDTLTSQEIGFELGLKAATVRQRVRRLKQSLQARLSERGFPNA